MTNPDIPRQPQLDPEAEARTRRVNRQLGYSSTFGDFTLPRRIIDGPYTSHIEGYPEYSPAEIEPRDDDLIVTYVSNEDGFTISLTDPKDPDAGYSEHFPARQKDTSSDES